MRRSHLMVLEMQTELAGAALLEYYNVTEFYPAVRANKFREGLVAKETARPHAV